MIIFTKKIKDIAIPMQFIEILYQSGSNMQQEISQLMENNNEFIKPFVYKDLIIFVCMEEDNPCLVLYNVKNHRISKQSIPNTVLDKGGFRVYRQKLSPDTYLFLTLGNLLIVIDVTKTDLLIKLDTNISDNECPSIDTISISAPVINGDNIMLIGIDGSIHIYDAQTIFDETLSLKKVINNNSGNEIITNVSGPILNHSNIFFSINNSIFRSKDSNMIEITNEFNINNITVVHLFETMYKEQGKNTKTLPRAIITTPTNIFFCDLENFEKRGYLFKNDNDEEILISNIYVHEDFVTVISENGIVYTYQIVNAKTLELQLIHQKEVFDDDEVLIDITQYNNITAILTDKKCYFLNSKYILFAFTIDIEDKNKVVISEDGDNYIVCLSGKDTEIISFPKSVISTNQISQIIAKDNMKHNEEELKKLKLEEERQRKLKEKQEREEEERERNAAKINVESSFKISKLFDKKK